MISSFCSQTNNILSLMPSDITLTSILIVLTRTTTNRKLIGVKWYTFKQAVLSLKCMTNINSVNGHNTCLKRLVVDNGSPSLLPICVSVS